MKLDVGSNRDFSAGLNRFSCDFHHSAVGETAYRIKRGGTLDRVNE
jgi:hypothetical protein